MAVQIKRLKTFTAGEALKAYRRVKLHSTADQVVYADAGEDFIGITQEDAASGKHVTVDLTPNSGTNICIASEALSAHAVIYGDDDGKVCDTVKGTGIGWALDAAVNAGDQIEVRIDKNVGETWS